MAAIRATPTSASALFLRSKRSLLRSSSSTASLPLESLMLTLSRLSLPSRPPLLRLSIPSLSQSSSSSIAPIFSGLRMLWERLLPGGLGGILRAVPKKKTSHSRKRMRSANKGLKEKIHVSACPACGRPKRTHHVCLECYGDIKRGWKADNKILEQQGGLILGA